MKPSGVFNEISDSQAVIEISFDGANPIFFTVCELL
jgi:hypothetical protein